MFVCTWDNIFGGHKQVSSESGRKSWMCAISNWLAYTCLHGPGRHTLTVQTSKYLCQRQVTLVTARWSWMCSLVRVDRQPIRLWGQERISDQTPQPMSHDTIYIYIIMSQSTWILGGDSKCCMNSGTCCIFWYCWLRVSSIQLQERMSDQNRLGWNQQWVLGHCSLWRTLPES